MTMRFTQLTTYWNADDANTVIEFLDELREVLWATYGDEIIEMRQAASESNSQEDESLDSDLEGEIIF